MSSYDIQQLEVLISFLDRLEDKSMEKLNCIKYLFDEFYANDLNSKLKNDKFKYNKYEEENFIKINSLVL